MWGCNWAIGQFTPVMLNNWGGANTFMFFMFMNILICIGVCLWVPETKDKTLEEIEAEFWPKNADKITNQTQEIDMSKMSLDELKTQIKLDTQK